MNRSVRIVSLGLALMLTGASAPIRVGLVLDKGGKDDKSFNAAAFEGATRAEKEFGIELKVVEGLDDTALESLTRNFARHQYDLIVAVGFAQAETVKKIATQFPAQKFAIVDAVVDLPNVRSLMFDEHEGSFLVGAIAAMVSKSGKIGFVGGMDIPLIRRFQMGYEAGAKKVNPKVVVVSNFVGVTGEAWNNPPKGKELALSQYSNGADIVFHAAGASGLGVFDAAEETQKLAIGVDSNQDWVKPGFVLTSMLKKVDVAVYEACSDVKKGNFSAGTKSYGLSNQGIDFSIDEHNKKILSAQVISGANQLKAEILAGKIQVPDYYKLRK